MASSKTQNSTTWVTTKTWTTGELVTKAMLDTYISAQENALKVPASFYIKIDEASDYSTSSATFVTLGGSEMSAAITTAGGTVHVFFSGECTGSAAILHMTVAVDGVAYVANDGVFGTATSSGTQPIFLGVAIEGLSAASHTFTIQWKISTGTINLYAGAGTASHDVHPQFWGFELG